MKAVLFDFNGTLFFDTEKHREAWKEYGSELMGRAVTDEEFQKSMLGRTNRSILNFLLGRMPSIDEEISMGNEKEVYYRRLCLEDPSTFHLAAGAENYLDYLKENGIICNIATSSNKENLDFYFDNFGLDKWFSKSLCIYDDMTFPGKPAPDIYIKAANRIGIDPRECMVFEDSLSGIHSAFAAKAGGITAVASSASVSVLAKQNGVIKVIKDYTELF